MKRRRSHVRVFDWERPCRWRSTNGRNSRNPEMAENIGTATCAFDKS